MTIWVPRPLVDRASRYGLAVALAAAAVALRFTLSAVLTGAQFITFFPAVVIAAYFGGWKPGLVTATLTGVAGWYFFVTPLFSFRFDRPIEALTLIVYFATAILIAVTVGATRSAIERERASSQALRASEEQFRVLADSSPALIWVTDDQAQVTFANRRYEEVFDQPANTIKGEGWRDIVHPEDVQDFNARFLEALTKRERFTGVVRVRDRANQIVWLHCEGVPRFTQDGAFLGYVGANLDITKAKRAEERLRELNEDLERRVEEAVTEHVREQQRLLDAEIAQREADALYRTYFQNSPEALFVIGVRPSGNFVVEQINPAHEAGVGFRAEEVVGRRIEDILPADAAARLLKTYQHVVDTREVYHFREVFDLDGRARHWDTSLVPMIDESGRVTRLIGSSRDVTPQIAAEEALRHSQKMEAMGQLTGGVAHDFNNLLTPIVGALDMLQRGNVGNDREQRLIAGAVQSAERAKTLVQRLLAFARRQPLQPVPVDVSRLIEEMADLVVSTTGPQIKVIVEAPDDLPPAVADPNQLEMAVLNLAVNARDAMESRRGTLRISASLEVIRTGQIAGLLAGSYIRLSVADTGVGMDEATIERAIEPFFSTKGIGKGTGLGLSMAHGLALQLGGRLKINSQRGVGTNVELWLPKSDDRPRERMSAEVPARLSSGSVILLVDDEDLVRFSTADILADLGHEVIEASSAEQAMALIKAGTEVDLLITDHLMPGMSGAQLAQEVQVLKPEVKVLLISGYAEFEGVPPNLARLAKPFRGDELAASLAKLAAFRKARHD